ncbi:MULTISPECIES: MaoC family dehydratase [unclassified Sphingomonas]|uniref:MaoC family dehydratase n=1 Tax=unclassified Sphingomonas TaxID=196159 RepID=UPI00082F904A|nr:MULTISPECIES: MaoC family dehydratase [unclassified Sphingomonas]
MIYFEDIVPGTRRSFGSYLVTREEVLGFAERYDPQPFHLSDDAAAQTHFGRLAASGWHTCAMTMSMLVKHMSEQEPAASLGAAGVDELRWLKPVYPGDTLRCETEVMETRASRSRPEMGTVRNKMTVFNQHDEPVMTFTAIGLYRTRSGAAAG